MIPAPPARDTAGVSPDPTVPADLGYRMPAEWEPHAGCWLAWPERPDVWRDGAAPAREAFARIAAAIHEVEPVTVTASAAGLASARALLPRGVELLEIPTDDAWMRDIGPTVLVDDRDGRCGIDWTFTAWGGPEAALYSPWDRDDAAAAAVLDHLGMPRYRTPFVFEGGAISVDGEGSALVTEQCLLDPHRNPGVTRAAVERVLHDLLAVERVIWLGQGTEGDETRGHVDDLAAFVAPGVVALTWCEDPDDPQHAVGLDARRRLEAAVDARGRSLEVHRLPHPGPLAVTPEEAAGLRPRPGSHPRPPGTRLAGTYVNWYLANGRVLVPLLDPRTDEEALSTIARLHPDRTAVGVPAREVLLGGGAIHCITQQIPAAQAVPPDPR